MTHIKLGNSAPIATAGASAMVIPAGSDVAVASPTEVTPLDPTINNITDLIVDDALTGADLIAAVDHAWKFQSAAAPGWVLSDNPAAQAAIEAHFGVSTPAPGDITMLLTNAGLDFFAKQAAGVASSTTIAKYLALTANATAPSASDTTLTAEIVTGGGGLLRAAATYAHTAAATTYTLTLTFTANGSDSLPVTIAKVGCFDAASTGNLIFEKQASLHVFSSGNKAIG